MMARDSDHDKRHWSEGPTGPRCRIGKALVYVSGCLSLLLAMTLILWVQAFFSARCGDDGSGGGAARVASCPGEGAG
jgi:hypothetical protein